MGIRALWAKGGSAAYPIGGGGTEPASLRWGGGAAVPSSVIASHSYDPDRAVLAVTFTSGRTYRYFAVPASVAAGLAAAPSKGRYFNARIRDRFPFEDATAA